MTVGQNGGEAGPQDDPISRDVRTSSTSSRRGSIVVFAKLPVPGRVKTRLAAGAGVGPENASDFYRACAEHAISQAASCQDWADVFVYHSSADATSDVASWLAREGLNLPCRPQAGLRIGSTCTDGSSGAGADGPSVSEPDLGDKIFAAMSEVLQCQSPKDGPAGKVLIVGTDIPDITAPLLRRAAEALDEHDMVVGPSLDGGYYLLGLTRLEPRLFQGMRWSTDSVLADTLERATSSGLRIAPLSWLPCLRDVDTLQADFNTSSSFSQGSSKDCRCESHERQPFSARQPQRQETLCGGSPLHASETEKAAVPPHLKAAGAPDGPMDLNMKHRRLCEVSQRVLKQAATWEVTRTASNLGSVGDDRSR
ncbi:hypothetical protein Vafri_12842 [Volvox africanus]|uniref:Glycosyltransferase n=1 Tax=Volvox africanus TaxID=51714 RepID=A0A8J4BB10_9CHLO|nr:hypothetical protein Vafri_12842 [Volvox africanus]